MKPNPGKDDSKEFQQPKRVRGEQASIDDISEVLQNNERSGDAPYLMIPEGYTPLVYDFLLKLAQEESIKSRGRETARLVKLNEMISKLESVPAVQHHIWETLSQSTQGEIAEIVVLIEEKRKLRKMGPIQKYVYKKKKNRK